MVREEGRRSRQEEGLMVTVTVGGQLQPETYDRHTQSHTHKHRRTTSEVPVPPPTHRRTHGEAATEALSRPPFCLKICICLNAQAERGACAEWGPWRSGLHSQHRRSDDRHAQCPPSADDRHHEEWTDKCCITKSLQTGVQ